MKDETERRRTVVCAGVIVDGETHTVHAGGRMLPVTAVMYGAGADERPGSDRVRTPELAAIALLVYKTPEAVAEACKRPIMGRSEALHFNVVCENGWWVEVTLWLEHDEMQCDLPNGSYDPYVTHTVADLLALLADISTRPTYVPQHEYDDPWCGVTRGHWLDDDFTPEEP